MGNCVAAGVKVAAARELADLCDFFGDGGHFFDRDGIVLFTDGIVPPRICRRMQRQFVTIADFPAEEPDM